MKKWVYNFGRNNENVSLDKKILGSKGYGLAVMSALGLQVPAGFTIITEACASYYSNNKIIDHEIWLQIENAIHNLENLSGKKFGSKEIPLLLSVRSGAEISMPGMMDTVLNLGLNDENVEAFGQMTQDLRFAYDTYRRFIEIYSSVVLNVDRYLFEQRMNYLKQQINASHDWQIPLEELKNLVNVYKNIVFEQTGESFPQDSFQQLRKTINAVFGSWHGDRAKKYRHINKISDLSGTAVNVQIMVFGNMGDDSLTGVMFTRNPSDGTKEIFGEFLPNAQGEDLVSGIRTPSQITEKSRIHSRSIDVSLESSKPNIFSELKILATTLENHFCDMQDIEFTVEKGVLWLLQTRNGKRSAKAAVKIAFDLFTEGKIPQHALLTRINTSEIEKLLHHTIDDSVAVEVMTRGLPASPGAASGVVAFSADIAEELSRNSKVILVRRETSPEDIGGIAAAEGILTTKGGMTSHAAVVARGMGKVCICGADKIVIDEDNTYMTIEGFRINAGEVITINGSTGDVIRGEVTTIKQQSFPELESLMQYADQTKRLVVRANAETEKDAQTAKDFGAFGIGLCRTEHMFFEPQRIDTVREMIFAQNTQEREIALKKIMPLQRADFEKLFTIMQGMPVTIRLLDPPLHEFLPVMEHDIEDLAQHLGITLTDVKKRINILTETNPMLGHRGCRLGITFPEIYKMQISAIFEAALNTGTEIVPEIMIPLVSDVNELHFLKKITIELHKTIAPHIPFLFGAMIELPRAIILAGEIAKVVDFISFGTNDLTQTTFGISRDDASSFLRDYLDKGIMNNDPFASIDEHGVGVLIQMAVEKSRIANPNIKIGICGEHGGDPKSIAFFEKLGLDYVSCSPYRIPIAKFAAARATLHNS